MVAWPDLGPGGAAAVPPTIRVRCIDRHTRESLDDVATVVFVPADEAGPFVVPLVNSAAAATAGEGGARLKALQTLPARKFMVKASAKGYAQLNYLDGPIALYYEHVVVDAFGNPQKEVVVEMERRVACVWLSCTDARTGAALPLAKVRLVDARGSGASFLLDKPGEHDVDVGRSDVAFGRDADYDVRLDLAGYLLWGPTRVTLTSGRRVELHVRCRATEVLVDARDLRSNVRAGKG